MYNVHAVCVQLVLLNLANNPLIILKKAAGSTKHFCHDCMSAAHLQDEVNDKRIQNACYSIARLDKKQSKQVNSSNSLATEVHR